MEISLETHSKKSKVTNRIFHHIKGKSPGATIVFFAGIHGNETAGVHALNKVLRTISENDVCGEVYGIYGNIKALEKNKRYLDSDLNRLWTAKRLNRIQHNTELNSEEQEQEELLYFINRLLAFNKRPIYFLDLHTTSSKTLPFITINDALINRKFSSCFPVPIVLGIEEYLEGPLLSYLNTLGYVSLGFESGQHTDPSAIKNCEAFVYLALKNSGILTLDDKEKISTNRTILKSASEDISSIFEVIYKYHIEPYEVFVMEDGFKSFQYIKKGTLLAKSNGRSIFSDYNGKLFMPLYQKSGNDGFFIIKTIPRFFLKLSAILRKIKADNILTLLPGISWHDKKLGVLKANLSVTRFMAKSIFHLLGYRNRELNTTELLLYNRERVSKKAMYKNEGWY